MIPDIFAPNLFPSAYTFSKYQGGKRYYLKSFKDIYQSFIFVNTWNYYMECLYYEN